MLRLHTSYNAAQAKDYFTDSLSRGDYYSEGQEMAGRWGGLLAQQLGLEGEVRQSDFFSLCENRLPGTNDNLTPRTKDGRRVGVDINFHAPKSVSLLYALGEDRRILDAFRLAMAETMAELEAEMRTRVRTDGQNSDRVTGVMAWAEFIHTTARPVNGIPDPHLHGHCFTFNVTHDPEEQRFKAGEFEHLKRKAPYYEARFHSRLAYRIAGLGYGVRLKGKFWEIEGIPDKFIERFSRRSAQIDELAVELGVENDPHLKSELGARTRERKNKADSFEELRKEWKERAAEWMDYIHSAKREAGKSHNDQEQSREDTRSQKSAETEQERGNSEKSERTRFDRVKMKAANDAVAYAVAHMFERKSTVTERALAEIALRASYGATEPHYIDAVLDKAPFIRRVYRGEEWVTTREVFKEEKQMLAFATETRGHSSPFVRGVYELRDKELNDGQRSAVRHVLNSYDQVMLIHGGAGTGKTKLMTETISAIERSGQHVLVMAPFSDTVRQTLPKQGFRNAETVAAFFASEQLQEKYQNGVLWVDEAGMLGVRTMNRLFEIAQERNCRVVLSGDRGQHKPIERGDGIDILIEEAGMQYAEVTAVVRQKGEYKEACEQLNKGKLAAGWDSLDKLGFIKDFTLDDSGMTQGEHERAREAHAKMIHRELAEEYVQAVKSRKSTLAISPTHKEGEMVTDAIRRKLQDEGYVAKKERELIRLKSLSWTDAEKSDIKNYAKGMVIQFHQNGRGMKASERGTVMGVKFGQVWVRGAGGPLLSLKLGNASKFTVYEQDKIELAVGDTIRFTRNGKTAGDLLGFLPDRRNPLRSPRQLAVELGQSFGLSEGHFEKKVRLDPRRLYNGASYRIIAFIPLSGDIVLQNGWVVSKNYGHLTHGYCLTSLASQSKGADVVVVAQTSLSFGKASNKEQFVVSATRGKESCKFYTDNKSELRLQIEKSTERVSASKMAREGERSTAKRSQRYRDHMKGRGEERTRDAERGHER